MNHLMRMLVQRVTEASVTVNEILKSSIGTGLLVFAGFEDSDTFEDILWGCKKIANLRIFEDDKQVPNLSLLETDGSLLLVSQFTLHAATKKGNRPSYIRASKGEVAIQLYNKMIAEFESILGKKIETGAFGLVMKVKLINDGPHTIWIDSKNKE